MPRLSRISSRVVAISVAALVGAGVVGTAPPVFAAAPSIVSVTPSPTVGLGAGQSGHAARQIVINVDNVATTDSVSIGFPGYSGLSALVQLPLITSGGHTAVTALVSTSPQSGVLSGFNLTLTDVTTGSSAVTPFAIVAAPTLSTASPARLLRGTTTSVAFAGAGMQSGVVASASAQSGVTFGTVTVGSGGSSGTVPVTVSNNAPGGPVAVTLTNPDAGWSSQSGALSVDTFAVNGISPTSAVNTPNTATQLTVTGTGIPPGSTVLALKPTFAVTGQNTIVVSPSSISSNGQTWQGYANLSDAAPGPYQAQLVNGADTGTLASSFTVNAVGAPTVSAVSPTLLGQGADSTLTVFGTNFAHGATVTFSRTGFTTTGPVVYLSSTQLQVPIHVASNAVTGSNNATNVTVTNTDARSGTKTSAMQVTPAPLVTGISPSNLGQGAATTLFISGANFQSGATVSFGTGVTAVGAPTVFSNQIRVPVIVASNAPTSVQVTVRNPDLGTSSTTLSVNQFVVTSVSPRYVPITFTGDLTISGVGFKSGATVSFPFGSGVNVQAGRSPIVASNGLSLTVPITVSRSTFGAVDVTVTNATTDLGSATGLGYLSTAVAPATLTNVVATKSGTTAVVRWDAVAPPRDGGVPLTNYTVSVTAPVGSGVPAQTLGPSVTTATFGNLALGVDYVFAVTATNAANLTSLPVSATTSRKSSLTLQAQTRRTTAGQPVPMSGRLLDVYGKPIGGATIVVQRRSDTGIVVVVGTVTTDAAGGWSIVATPWQSQMFSAAFGGDGNNDASVSNVVRVVVAPRVTINATILAAGDELKVYGRVTLAHVGTEVRLVGFNSGRLRHFDAVFLDGNSRYRFLIALPAGHWRFQVRISQTVGNGQGQSPDLVING